MVMFQYLALGGTIPNFGIVALGMNLGSSSYWQVYHFA
jgi:hypothetical protein